MITKDSDSTRRTQRLALYSAAGVAAIAQMGHGSYITGGPHTGTGTTAYGAWTYNQTLLSSSTLGLGAQFRLAAQVDTGAGGVGTAIRGDYRMIVGSGVANGMQFLGLAPIAPPSAWQVSQYRVQAAGTANNLGFSAVRRGQMLAQSAAISANAAGEWKSNVVLNFGESNTNSWTNPLGVYAPGWSTSNATGSTTGYLGFRFQSSGNWLYGWMEIEVFKDLANQNSISIRVNGWAYDNTGASVLAGVGGASAVPGGAGLAALAFGAAGLRGRRRSRN